MANIRQFYFNKNEDIFSTYPNLSVIIGRASKGPICTPIFTKEVTPDSFKKVAQIFGYDSELLQAFVEASDGTTQLCLINIDGEYASLDIKDIFHIESIEIDEIYDKGQEKEIKVIFNNKIIGFQSGADRYLEYTLAGETLNSLCQKINNDSALGLNPVIVNTTFNHNSLPATVLIEELSKLSLEERTLAKRNDKVAQQNKIDELFSELVSEKINSISILNYSFYDKNKRYFYFSNIKRSSSVMYSKDISSTEEEDSNLFIQRNICLELKINDIDERYFDIDNILYFDSENSFKVIGKKGSTLYIIKTDETFIEDLSYLEDYSSFYLQEEDLYTVFDKLIKEYNVLGESCMINIGIKQEEEIDEEKIIKFYNRNREKEIVQNKKIFNPFINIIIDKYKTSLYYSEYDIYSNGVPFLLKAINNVNEYDNIIGYINDLFIDKNHNISDIEIEELSSMGYITNCLYKNKYRINSGKNLSYAMNPVLGSVGNTILLNKISKDITNSIDLTMSDIVIKNNISQILKGVYSDVISNFNIDVSSFIENKKTIGKTVTLDISIYGYIQSVSLDIEVK